MSFRFLMDENLKPLYKTQLRLKKPDIVVQKVGDPGCSPKGTRDPEILCWCEENGFILVTDNRTSMPPHLRAHLAQGRHIPGIIVLKRHMKIGEILEELLFIAEDHLVSDYKDSHHVLACTPTYPVYGVRSYTPCTSALRGSSTCS